MDHEVATTTHAIERYLLGEMPATERDAFEEHYFSCAECAAEIRSASDWMRDMKAALVEEESRPKVSPPSRFSWFRIPVLVPTFAAVTLAVVVGYQNLSVLPDLQAPRSISSALILDGRTRSDVPAINGDGALRFLTAVDGATSARLFVEVLSSSGSSVRRGEVAAPPAGRPLDVYFPGTLGVGRYDLVVRDGQEGRELTRSTFAITKE